MFEVPILAILFSIFRVFTPELIDWYNRFKKGPKGNLLNIVFVSLDEHEESWREYSSGMPWYGVNFNDKARQVYILVSNYLIITCACARWLATDI